MSRQTVPLDVLPEDTRYRDTGCSLSPSCLNCPLVRCRYDEPAGAVTVRRADRDARILALRRQHLPVREVARRAGVTTRTVQRALRRNGL